MKTALEATRESAVEEGERELAQLGFIRDSRGAWRGTLQGESGRAVAVRFQFPKEFPDAAPEVILAEEQAIAGLAHVERSGKVCIAPSTGVLFDASRPRQLVRDALKRAEGVLLLSEERHRADRLVEFSAYWPSDAAGAEYYSICDVPLKAGPVRIYDGVGPLGLIADSEKRAFQWLRRTGKKSRSSREAYSVPLELPMAPPDFSETLTLRRVRDVIRARTTEASFMRFWIWLQEKGFPAVLVLSQVLPKGGTVLFALNLPGPPAPLENDWKKGFRAGHEPPDRQITYALAQKCKRIGVRRVDQAFLLERVGAGTSLLSHTVAIVGCGAVGSHLALALAGSGIGKLHLIDKESLAPENQHRHALGASYVGLPKPEALKVEIGRRYPEVEVTTAPTDILSILSEPKTASTLHAASLLVVALGDQTLELRLNELLRRQIPRIHVWLEPRGLGGHVAVTGFQHSTGCYACMFRSDPEHGIVNESSMTAAGQDLLETLEGCAGVFTPFGLVDAQRAGLECARVAMETLAGEAKESHIITWQTSRAAFIAAGGQLSARGKEIEPGHSRREPLGLRGCPRCGRWAA